MSWAGKYSTLLLCETGGNERYMSAVLASLESLDVFTYICLTKRGMQAMELYCSSSVCFGDQILGMGIDRTGRATEVTNIEKLR